MEHHKKGYHEESGMYSVFDSTTMHQPIQKSYIIRRKMVKGDIYDDNAMWLVNWWFYHNPWSSEVTISIHGSWHQTYPNPPHLSVEFISAGKSSGILHISINAAGNIYVQSLRDQPFHMHALGRGYDHKHRNRTTAPKTRTKKLTKKLRKRWQQQKQRQQRHQRQQRQQQYRRKRQRSRKPQRSRKRQRNRKQNK